MDILNLAKLLNETRAESGKGSAQGRAAIQSDTEKASSKKSRVFVYNSIMDALKKGKYGQMFSTKKSNRLYVVTKRKWGKSPDQEYAGRVAKGFSQGSIPSSFGDVKNYSQRTLMRHGKGKKVKK